jgi:4-carboxymuconolactone decarboxylase
MTEAQRTVAEEIAAGPRGGVRGPFIALLHNPPLAQRLQSLGEYLRFQTAFSKPLTEVAILVTARHWSCQYEWVAHEKIARAAGLDPAIIAAIQEGRRPEAMSEDEQVVHDFCGEVHRDGEPGAASFAAAESRFGKAGALDLLALCGYYAMLAMVLNTAQPDLPEGMEPPLKPLPGGR